MYCNNKVKITRLIDGINTEIIKDCYNVYLQPRGEKVINSLDNQGAYKEFMMMTDGKILIEIGDKIEEGVNKYIVNGGQIFNDLTGKHGQYILFIDYE